MCKCPNCGWEKPYREEINKLFAAIDDYDDKASQALYEDLEKKLGYDDEELATARWLAVMQGSSLE